MNEDRLAAIEARLQAAEDELAIIRLLSTTGVLVDSGQGRAAAETWTEDGVYAPGGLAPIQGHAALAGVFEGPHQQEMASRGAGHILPAPIVTLRGDEAEAVGYTLLVTKAESGWATSRASANHWTLKRTPAGWRIVDRQARLIDGSQEARDTLLPNAR